MAIPFYYPFDLLDESCKATSLSINQILSMDELISKNQMRRYSIDIVWVLSQQPLDY